VDALALLGDILSDAIKREEEAERAHQAEVERWALVTSAAHLARAIADTSNISAAEAFDALTWVPDACLPLLTSPHGWTALALIVVTDLQATATGTVHPTVH
jgi:hypothetical protein